MDEKIMQEAIEKAVEQYRRIEKEGCTNKERAQLEQYMWGCKCALGRKSDEKDSRRTWLVSILGGNPSNYDIRQALLRAGDWADELFTQWDRREITASAAADLVREVKKLAKTKKMAHKDALNTILKKKEKKTEKREEKEENGSDQMVLSKAFKNGVLSLAAGYVVDSLGDVVVSDVEKDRVLAEFKEDFSRTAEEFFSNTRQLKNRGKFENTFAEIGRINFKTACDVASLSDAVYGRPLPIPWSLIKRNLNRRALANHPDSNPENPEAIEEFHRIVDARKILTKYEKQYGAAKLSSRKEK